MAKLQIAPDLLLSEYDRSRNLLITGTPGTGVTQLLYELINQDIQADQSVILFDPYGDLSDKVINSQARRFD